MTHVIAILNSKGGSGKTTFTTNLAGSLHERGYSVLIVDSDEQGSARDWHATDEDNPISLVALDRPQSLKSLGTIKMSYDFVLIDGAAKLEAMIAASIRVSDFVLIPVQPSPYDLWPAADLVDIIKARQEITEGRPAASFVISRGIQGTTLGKDIKQALNDCGLNLFNTPISQRQIYPQTASEGLTVFASKNKEAVKELNSLTDEILNFITQKEEENGTIIQQTQITG